MASQEEIYKRRREARARAEKANGNKPVMTEVNSKNPVARGVQMLARGVQSLSPAQESVRRALGNKNYSRPLNEKEQKLSQRKNTLLKMEDYYKTIR